MQTARLMFLSALAMAQYSSVYASDPDSRLVITEAVVFDLSLKNLGTLDVGAPVTVLKTITDRSNEQWLLVRCKLGTGYIRASKVSKAGSHENPTETEDVALVILPSNTNGVADLGFRLLRAAPFETTNLAVSPYGLWANARLWLRGARGETRTRLLDHLGFDEEVAGAIASKGSVLTVNRLLKRPSINLTAAYTQFARDFQVFTRDSLFDEPARLELNDWIYTWSQRRIPNFYSRDQWNPDATLVFVNVSTLDAEWVHKFDKDFTEPTDFHITAKETTKVDTMLLQADLKRFSTESFSGVVLPYAKDNLVAVVVVPSAVDGLPRTLSQLNGADMQAILASSTKQKVILFLPKFEITSSLDLFQRLGLDEVLPQDADFTGLSETPTTVSGIQQKVQITVDEDGTRAAAATATQMMGSGVDTQKPVILRADHPFLFTVIHLPSGTPLFTCRVENPPPPQNAEPAPDEKSG